MQYFLRNAHRLVVKFHKEKYIRLICLLENIARTTLWYLPSFLKFKCPLIQFVLIYFLIPYDTSISFLPLSSKQLKCYYFVSPLCIVNVSNIDTGNGGPVRDIKSL